MALLLVVAGLVVLLSPPIRPAAGQWRPADSYAVDCGSVAGTRATDTLKQWQGESNSSFVSAGVSVAAAGQNADLPASVPYLTARVFSSRSSYTFPIDPGRHWVRLYFYPFQAAGFDPARANFSVAVGQYELFSDSIVEAVKRLGAVYLVQEYSVPVASANLSIVFTPATNESIAFINGIEVMSTPPDAFKDDAALAGQPQKFGLESLAFQTMYRINVGGASVNPMNDTQHRSWLPDQKFIQGAAVGSPSFDSISSIKYPSTVPEYIAPASVYGTARVIGSSDTVNNNVNVSWKFEVDPGYVYYVRLHFAELIFDLTSQRIFNIYINNRTVLPDFDVIALAPKFTPIYRDFAVPMQDGLSSIRVQMGPSPNSVSQYRDAILNGLEILKMNNTEGSLAESSYVQVGADPRNLVHKSSSTVGAIVGTVFGVVAAAAVLGGLGLLCCRKTKAGKILPLTWRPLPQPSEVPTSLVSVGSAPSLASSTQANSCRHFTFEQMLDATDNFNDELLVGVGGFGKVYKGDLDGGLKVAVKRGNPASQQGLTEFRTEIEMLSQLRHRHLVSLIGYCDENAEMILVYDYMANGPLRGHLYGADLPPLSWQQRLEICIGAARGLHYLHTGAARAIIHRDVKTTNILLDDNLVAKVADFGLSKVGPSLEHTHVSTAVKGSFGYLDPEYYRRQQLTEKSDVYSFGVVLMEVVCARPAINPALSREQVNMAEWAMHWQKRGMLQSIIDPKLAGDVTPESLQKFGETAESCLNDRGSERPSMGQVLWNLEYAFQLHQASMHSTTLANGGGGSQATELLPLRHYAEASMGAGVSENNLPTVDATPSEVFSQLVNPRGR